MKNILTFILSVSLVIAGSCTGSAPEDMGERQNLRVTADVKGGADGGNLSYYIFDSSGCPVYSCRGSSEGSDIFLLKGTYTVYGFANACGLPEHPCSADELHLCGTYLTDNRPGHFVASGEVENIEVNDDSEIVLVMKRYISVVTARFTNLLRDETFRDVPVIVKDIFLVNVAGENNLGLSGMPDASGTWYNRMGMYPGEADALVSASGVNLEVGYGESVEPEIFLYAYPNEAPEPSDRTVWCIRPTRLVFRVSISGDTFFYPVTFSEIRPGRHYHVDFTATVPGLEDPETDPLSVGLAGSVVTISEWVDGTETEEVL